MSPRLASAITSSPRERASFTRRSSAIQPGGPSRSKNATCGFTTATRSETASSSSSAKRCTADAATSRLVLDARCASGAGKSSSCGSMPRQTGERLAAIAASSRSAKVAPLMIDAPSGEPRGSRARPRRRLIARGRGTRKARPLRVEQRRPREPHPGGAEEQAGRQHAEAVAARRGEPDRRRVVAVARRAATPRRCGSRRSGPAPASGCRRRSRPSSRRAAASRARGREKAR